MFAGTFDPSASGFTTFRADTFIQVVFQDLVDTSATDNATITLVGSMQKVGTWQDASTSTVDYIATSNVEVGTHIWLLGNTGNIVLTESGNMIFNNGAKTLTENNFVKLIMTGANEFIVEN